MRATELAAGVIGPVARALPVALRLLQFWPKLWSLCFDRAAAAVTRCCPAASADRVVIVVYSPTHRKPRLPPGFTCIDPLVSASSPVASLAQSNRAVNVQGVAVQLEVLVIHRFRACEVPLTARGLFGRNVRSTARQDREAGHSHGVLVNVPQRPASSLTQPRTCISKMPRSSAFASGCWARSRRRRIPPGSSSLRPRPLPARSSRCNSRQSRGRSALT